MRLVKACYDVNLNVSWPNSGPANLPCYTSIYPKHFVFAPKMTQSTFDFTKKKRWADILITETADVIALVEADATAEASLDLVERARAA